MLDYRNNLKRILQNIAGDEQSLRNGLSAIEEILRLSQDNEAAKQDNPEPSKSKTVANHAAQKNIKNFLAVLTDFLQNLDNEKKQKKVLTALHRLSFNAEIGKNYGRELGKLDQAVQHVAVTHTTVNQKIFEQAVKPRKKVEHKDYRKGRRYTVIRMLTGCDLVNGNKTVFSLKESQIHSLDLKTGDIVEALPKAEDAPFEADVLRVVGHQKIPQATYDQISTFKYAVIQGGRGHWAIAHDIHGNKLRIRGKNLVLPISENLVFADQEQLTDGAIVDLAWYSGDIRLRRNPEEAIKLRWIYQTDLPKHKANKKRKKIVSEKPVVAQLNLDLHYQRVGIAIGDNQNEAMLEGIVKRYHGLAFPINAFQGRKKIIEQQIRELDIVILVTAFAAHDSTWNIREFASKYHVKFAVSSSKGYRAFERALYRAANGLPAYEGSQAITYQTRE